MVNNTYSERSAFQTIRKIWPGPWFLLPILCAGLILGSCDAFPGMVENPGPQQILSPQAPTELPSSPTPGPEIDILSLTLLPGENPDSGQGIGRIINNGEVPLGDISVTLTYHGQDGGILDTVTTRSIPSSLLPGEEAIIAFEFSGPLIDADTTSEIHATKVQRVQRAQGEVQEPTWNHNPQGDTVILGQITNTGFSQAKLIDLTVLLLDEGHEPVGYATLVASTTHIPPGQSSTFSAAANGSYEPDDLEFFVDMIVDKSPPEPDLRFQELPTLQFTDQDVPFFLGSIQNPSQDWVWASGLINLESDGELVGIASIDPPLPVQPEGVLSFSIQHFWGLSPEILSSEEAMRALDIHSSVEGISSLPADETVSQLMLSVSQYEAFDSLVFFHGEVTNGGNSPIHQPTVFVTARNSTGLLYAARWVTPVDSLAPGAGIEFELSLLLPGGADPAKLEFDVIAFGIHGG